MWDGDCAMISIFTSLFGTLVLSFVLYLLYKHRMKRERHKVLCTTSIMTSFILERCKRLSCAPDAPLWASNGHIQTLLTYITPTPYFSFDREYIMLKDGGAVAIDWSADLRYKLAETSAILLIIPDTLSEAHSVSNLCCVASSRGYRPVVFNKRGLGDSFLLTPRLQTYGDPSDFRYIVKYIKNQYPQSRLTAVAHGMGTNLLLSYLGEYGSSCLISAAVCISPGYDAEYLLDDCIPFPYTYFMLYMLKRQLGRHVLALSKHVDIDKVMTANSLTSYEEYLYCRPNGYKSLSQYWEKNNPMRDVDEITIPVLCVNSSDDPICRSECIPYSLFTDCPNFMLVISPFGGYCGFYEGNELDCWADLVSVDYLTAVLELLAKNKYASQFS